MVRRAATSSIRPALYAQQMRSRCLLLNVSAVAYFQCSYTYQDSAKYLGMGFLIRMHLLLS